MRAVTLVVMVAGVWWAAGCGDNLSAPGPDAGPDDARAPLPDGAGDTGLPPDAAPPDDGPPDAAPPDDGPPSDGPPGPVIDTATARVDENGRLTVVRVTGHDAEGDVTELHARLVDATGSEILDPDTGTPVDQVLNAAPFTGQTTIDVTYRVPLGAGEIGDLQLVALRLYLVDAAGAQSPAVDAAIVVPIIVPLGGDCSAPDAECQGELECVGDVCSVPSGASATCAAADASAPITVSGTYTVTIPAGAPDTLAGSCSSAPGLGEAVMRIAVGGSNHVRLTARTDAPPSPGNLDSYLYLRATCTDPGSERGCNDDLDPSRLDRRSALVVPDLAPGTYYLVVDGSSVDAGYTASGGVGVSLALEIIKNPGEACAPGVDLCPADYLCLDPAGGTDTTCVSRAALAAAACAAVDATPGHAASGSFPVVIPAGAPDVFSGTCAFQPGLGETVVKILVAGPWHVRLTARTDVPPSPANLDSYVYLRATCTDPGSERGCQDDIEPFAGNYRSSLTVDDLAPGTYYLFVDGSAESAGYTAHGDVGVQLDFQLIREPGEACLPGTDLCRAGHYCVDPAGGTATTCLTAAQIFTGVCAHLTPLEPGTPAAGTLSPSLGYSLFDGSCSYRRGLPERFYSLTLAERSLVTLSTDGTGTDCDTVVYVLSTCGPGAAEVAGACGDDLSQSPPINLRSLLTVTLEPGTYAVGVDLSSLSNADQSGPAADPSRYSLLVTATPSP
jgi:hypothetical protein